MLDIIILILVMSHDPITASVYTGSIYQIFIFIYFFTFYYENNMPAWLIFLNGKFMHFEDKNALRS